MRKEKPHKKIINKMKKDYIHAKNDARRRRLSKEQQVDLAYLQDKIERYWFRFFADHYIMDDVKRFCEIVDSAPLLRRRAA